jgi:hypothetical protein
MKKNYSKLILISSLLFILLFAGTSFAQLTGTKTIPGDYTTIEAAINALDTLGVGPGGVIFNVAAGHTETFTSDSSGKISATGTVANPIIFQKSGVGANPKITAATGTGTRDGVIILRGGDYFTFDGIDVAENPVNTDNLTRMEWGYALLKKSTLAPANGCNFISIKNSTITLDKLNTATWGIYAANHTDTATTSSTMTDSSDVMSYCKFDNNTIDSYNGIRIISSTTAGFFGKGNEIGVIAVIIFLHMNGTATA